MIFFILIIQSLYSKEINMQIKEVPKEEIIIIDKEDWEGYIEEIKEEEIKDEEIKIKLNTKIDDVSNLDIVKEQRKQRAMKREIKLDTKKISKKNVLIDTIVVNGTVIQGVMTQFTSRYIVLKMKYGEGAVKLRYSEIESINTEHTYHIYFDGKETEGKIIGIKEHSFLKINHGNIEELIRISKIDRLVLSINNDSSFFNKMRNKFPYLKSNISFGLEFENGVNKKNKVKIGAGIKYKKINHLLLVDFLYSFEETKTQNSSKVLNEDELVFFSEYDIYKLNSNNFLFSELGYDYDIPRNISGRFYPSSGYGYKFEEEDDKWVKVKVGLGYVYSKFIDYGNDDFTSLFLGLDGEYKIDELEFLKGITINGKVFFMPSINGIRNEENKWLLRYLISMSFPLNNNLNLRFSYRGVDDDNPTPEIGSNKTITDLLLDFKF